MKLTFLKKLVSNALEEVAFIELKTIYKRQNKPILETLEKLDSNAMKKVAFIELEKNYKR
ncbi:MAG: hypothetical protein RR436_04080 [Clostridia bacterium]